MAAPAEMGGGRFPGRGGAPSHDGDVQGSVRVPADVWKSERFTEGTESGAMAKNQRLGESVLPGGKTRNVEGENSNKDIKTEYRHLKKRSAGALGESRKGSLLTASCSNST